MTRIQILVWSFLILAAAADASLDATATRADLNDLLHAQAFQGRSLQDLEELTLEELEEAKRALRTTPHDEEVVRDLQVVETPEGEEDWVVEKAVQGYFATQAPTSAPMPGDFANLNALLENTVLALPDTDIQEMLLYQLLQIALRNMECSQISVDDIKITPDLRSQQEAGLGFDAVNVGLQCEFDFEWSYIFLVGNGHANVRIGDSHASGAMDFFSVDFSQFPPESAQVTSCNTDINILGITFSGNIASEIFNLFEQLIMDVLNDLLNEMVCGELKEAGAELIGSGLDMIYDFIGPILEPVEAWRYNVTYPEDTMIVPEDVTLTSWNDEDGIGEFMLAAMEEMEEVLGSLQEDENAPNETLIFPNGTEYPDGHDLGINVMLRSYLLDDDRSLTINGTVLSGFNQSSTLFSMHDDLTETNISLVELKVHGLDTITIVEPFQRYGNFTLENAFSWEYLSFDVTIQMEMKASSKEGSFIRDPERVEPYVEQISASVGIEDLNTIIGVMVALDPAKVSQLQLGSLLDLMSAIPCLLGSLHQISIADMNVSVGNIRPPTVEGLVSPGLDRLLKDGMEFGFFMYVGTILQAIPSLFQSLVRDLVEGFLDDFSCPAFELQEEDEFMDMRDLLLDMDEAAKSGATGEGPYGDLTSTIYGIGAEMWQEVEEDGSLGLNSYVIEPITEAISGVPGRLRFPGVLGNFTTNEDNQKEFKQLVNKFEVVVYDLRVDNLNTVVHPMAVIQPVNHPYITQSTINMGPMEDAPINVSVTLLMSLDIEDSPLAMLNVVDMGVSVASIEIFTEMLAMLSQNNFLGFRMEDALNPSCWLSVVTPPELNEEGYRIEGTKDQGVEIRRLLAKISGLQLHIDCIQCSPGLDSLPQMVDIFERSKVTSVLSYRIPLFAEEIAISEPMQVAFDRWLIQAPHACPHRPEYDEDYNRPEAWETPAFTSLSVEAGDTIFFTAVAAAELAIVLVVETHYPWDLDTLQPLSGQEDFIAPEGSKLYNWTNLTDFVDGVSNDARDYVSEVWVDGETKIEDLGVNHLVRKFGTGPEGEIDFVALIGSDPIEFIIEGVLFQFHSIKVRGLDSFTRFDVLKPIAPQTILNSMHMEYLEIDVEMSTGSRTASDQNFEFSFGFKDLNATVPLFAAIDANFLKALELGHFLMTDDAFSCFLTSAVDIHFPQILLTLGGLSAPTFKGFLPDSGDALRKSMEEVFERYGERALKALPIMFDVSARTFINTYISDYIRDKANCTHIEDSLLMTTPFGDEVHPNSHPYNGYVDFRDLLLNVDNSTALGGRGDTSYGDIIRSVVTPIQEEILWVDPETGLSSANEFLSFFAEFLSGEAGTFIVPNDFIPSDLFTFDLTIGALIAKISLTLGNIRLENVDTIGSPLDLLMPVFMRPFHLRNSAGIGIGGKPFTISVPFNVEITQMDEGGTEIDNVVTNNMIIKLSMDDAAAMFDVMAMVNENELIHFPMEDIFLPYCWLSLIPAPKLNEYGIKEDGEVSYLSLADVAVSVGKLNLTVECVQCQTSGIQNLIEILASPGASESVTEIANYALDIVSDLVKGNLVQDQIDRTFKAVKRYCPHHPEYIEPGDVLSDILNYKPLDFSTSIEVNSLVYLLTGIVFSLVIGVTIITTVVKWIVNRRHRKWLRTLPVQKVHIIQHLQGADDQLERELNEWTSAMITTKEIPAFVRWFMPVVILGNIAMFLSGHISTAGDVAMTIHIAGEEIPLDQFFSFSIIESAVQLWDAGVEEMSIFILTFSGIWPYVKQILSLLCWVIPPSMLSISTRGKVYLWLDILAKWSMVDIFVLLLYMMSFRVEATTPDVAFLPENFFGLEFYIIPKWGIYANLIAQMISQVSSHFIIYYHRSIVRRATRDYEARHALMHKPETVNTAEESDDHSDDSESEKGRLCDGAFARPHKGESSKLIARQVASYGLVVGTFLLVVFMIIGCSYPFMSIEVQGLMSYLSGENAYTKFNVFDVATTLYNDGVRLGGFGNIVGHLLLGCVLILTVFIVPLLQTFALAYLWFKPMDDKQRKKFSEIIEILAAWQYSEVFILATLVGAWQQGQNSELVMYETCSDFNTIFEMLAYYGVIEREKAHCFRVEASILAGLYFMLVGCVLLGILSSFVMKASYQHFWDKECIRKEEAMDEHLTPEEAASPVDDKTYKEIRPPPVLFTDSFRWLLRPEHLGDRPLKAEPLKGLVVEGRGDGLDEIEKLSSAGSISWQEPKSVEESLTKSADETASKSVDGSLPLPESIDVDDLDLSKRVDVDDLNSTDVYC